MAKKKQRLCRICKKNPVWHYKNSPGNVCKRCYHKYVWAERPSARKAKQSTEEIDETEEFEELIFDGYSGEFYPLSQKLILDGYFFDDDDDDNDDDNDDE